MDEWMNAVGHKKAGFSLSKPEVTGGRPRAGCEVQRGSAYSAYYVSSSRFV